MCCRRSTTFFQFECFFSGGIFIQTNTHVKNFTVVKISLTSLNRIGRTASMLASDHLLPIYTWSALQRILTSSTFPNWIWVKFLSEHIFEPSSTRKWFFSSARVFVYSKNSRILYSFAVIELKCVCLPIPTINMQYNDTLQNEASFDFKGHSLWLLCSSVSVILTSFKHLTLTWNVL